MRGATTTEEARSAVCRGWWQSEVVVVKKAKLTSGIRASGDLDGRDGSRAGESGTNCSGAVLSALELSADAHHWR